MSSENLSHREIWDDSALIRSWDDAVAEYQHYHSIQARGISLEEALMEEEAPHAASLNTQDQNALILPEENDPAPERSEVPSLVTTEVEDVTNSSEDQMVIDKEVRISKMKISTTKLTKSNLKSTEPVVQPPETDAKDQLNTAPIIPQMLVGNIKDEALKNLMMSWYYAGYYTGIYEGRQQAQQSQSVGHDSKIASG
ncbi:MAG: hypothetical protein M1829_003779 [Trizodia sp. TS-e1964]|nr:MAG: hypothetical protein M1829_003779 [Trizodia sp. TS-e1964]